MGQKLTMYQVLEFKGKPLYMISTTHWSNKYTMIFQAEIYAIRACVQENLRRGYLGNHIHILFDSQATLKELTCYHTRSQLAWECKQNLILLAKHNTITFVWVPGHQGIAGNEKSRCLGKERVCKHIYWA
jgi:ribonuclease HI